MARKVKKGPNGRRPLPKRTYWNLIELYKERALESRLGLDWIREEELEYDTWELDDMWPDMYDYE